METKVFERSDDYMTSDDVAMMLVQLYGDYQHYSGVSNDDYARAVGIAIRMLSD